ncbi:MAG: hypothetical protein COB04_16185 [Gammaproteobacteria bacterium]|nr:MAG: hypothetical protein COB04_16185 [Gammaproteobacteria bacterium]
MIAKFAEIGIRRDKFTNPNINKMCTPSIIVIIAVYGIPALLFLLLTVNMIVWEAEVGRREFALRVQRDILFLRINEPQNRIRDEEMGYDSDAETVIMP